MIYSLLNKYVVCVEYVWNMPWNILETSFREKLLITREIFLL